MLRLKYFTVKWSIHVLDLSVTLVAFDFNFKQFAAIQGSFFQLVILQNIIIRIKIILDFVCDVNFSMNFIKDPLQTPFPFILVYIFLRD